MMQHTEHTGAHAHRRRGATHFEFAQVVWEPRCIETPREYRPSVHQRWGGRHHPSHGPFHRDHIWVTIVKLIFPRRKHQHSMPNSTALTMPNFDVLVGKSIVIQANPLDDADKPQILTSPVSYVSSNDAFATVTPDPLAAGSVQVDVGGAGEGVAVITASAMNDEDPPRQISSSFSVTVKAPVVVASHATHFDFVQIS